MAQDVTATSEAFGTAAVFSLQAPSISRASPRTPCLELQSSSDKDFHLNLNSSDPSPQKFFPLHLRSIFFWLCTPPNLLTYARVPIQIYSVFLYHTGESKVAGTRNPYVLAPLLALLFNQCVLDVADGPIARYFGWCTSIGRFLDMSTDYFALALFLPYFGQVLVRSQDPDLMIPLSVRSEYPYLVFVSLAIYYWFSLCGVGLCFAGNWKEITYSCPITRFYYLNDWSNNFLYISYFLMLAGLYLWADGLYVETGKFLFHLTVLPGLARIWAADVVCTYTMIRKLFEADREEIVGQETLRLREEKKSKTS